MYKSLFFTVLCLFSSLSAFADNPQQISLATIARIEECARLIHSKTFDPVPRMKQLKCEELAQEIRENRENVNDAVNKEISYSIESILKAYSQKNGLCSSFA